MHRTPYRTDFRAEWLVRTTLLNIDLKCDGRKCLYGFASYADIYVRLSNAFVLRPSPGKSNVAMQWTDRHTRNARAWAQGNKERL